MNHSDVPRPQNMLNPYDPDRKHASNVSSVQKKELTGSKPNVNMYVLQSTKMYGTHKHYTTKNTVVPSVKKHKQMSTDTSNYKTSCKKIFHVFEWNRSENPEEMTESGSMDVSYEEYDNQSYSYEEYNPSNEDYSSNEYYYSDEQFTSEEEYTTEEEYTPEENFTSENDTSTTESYVKEDVKATRKNVSNEIITITTGKSDSTEENDETEESWTMCYIAKIIAVLGIFAISLCLAIYFGCLCSIPIPSSEAIIKKEINLAAKNIKYDVEDTQSSFFEEMLTEEEPNWNCKETVQALIQKSKDSYSKSSDFPADEKNVEKYQKGLDEKLKIFFKVTMKACEKAINNKKKEQKEKKKDEYNSDISDIKTYGIKELVEDDFLKKYVKGRVKEDFSAISFQGFKKYIEYSEEQKKSDKKIKDLVDKYIAFHEFILNDKINQQKEFADTLKGRLIGLKEKIKTDINDKKEVIMDNSIKLEDMKRTCEDEIKSLVTYTIEQSKKDLNEDGFSKIIVVNEKLEDIKRKLIEELTESFRVGGYEAKFIKVVNKQAENHKELWKDQFRTNQNKTQHKYISDNRYFLSQNVNAFEIVQENFLTKLKVLFLNTKIQPFNRPVKLKEEEFKNYININIQSYKKEANLNQLGHQNQNQENHQEQSQEEAVLLNEHINKVFDEKIAHIKENYCTEGFEEFEEMYKTRVEEFMKKKTDDFKNHRSKYSGRIRLLLFLVFCSLISMIIFLIPTFYNQIAAIVSGVFVALFILLICGALSDYIIKERAIIDLY